VRAAALKISAPRSPEIPTSTLSLLSHPQQQQNNFFPSLAFYHVKSRVGSGEKSFSILMKAHDK